MIELTNCDQCSYRTELTPWIYTQLTDFYTVGPWVVGKSIQFLMKYGIYGFINVNSSNIFMATQPPMAGLP